MDISNSKNSNLIAINSSSLELKIKQNKIYTKWEELHENINHGYNLI